MARNVALFGRRELIAHRQFVEGVTATVPAYKVVDEVGNKEWVVDVYIGPAENVELNIVRDVPIPPYARQVIGDIRQPVLMERSKQGKYVVIGRNKIMPSGAQMPDGSILEPTYHRIEHNLASLSALFVADLDWTVEGWGEKTWDDGGPWQRITATDAFGNDVIGGEVDPEDIPPMLDLEEITTTTTRHVLLTLRTWGNPTETGGFRWGVDAWGAGFQRLIEVTE